MDLSATWTAGCLETQEAEKTCCFGLDLVCFVLFCLGLFGFVCSFVLSFFLSFFLFSGLPDVERKIHLAHLRESLL